MKALQELIPNSNKVCISEKDLYWELFVKQCYAKMSFPCKHCLDRVYLPTSQWTWSHWFMLCFVFKRLSVCYLTQFVDRLASTTLELYFGLDSAGSNIYVPLRDEVISWILEDLSVVGTLKSTVILWSCLAVLKADCNLEFSFQTDKASMLDEAIEYLRTLQLQIQVQDSIIHKQL
jgi:hypothetical protein